MLFLCLGIGHILNVGTAFLSCPSVFAVWNYLPLDQVPSNVVWLYLLESRLGMGVS